MKGDEYASRYRDIIDNRSGDINNVTAWLMCIMAILWECS